MNLEFNPIQDFSELEIWKIEANVLKGN